MRDTFPCIVLAEGLGAAFVHLVAPELLEFEWVGRAIVLGALLFGALAVYLVVLKLVAGRHDELRQLPWSSTALIAVGGGLLMWVSAATGDAAGRAASLTAPALGVLCVGIALWSLRRRGRNATA